MREKELEQSDKQKLLAQSEISLWLDSYDDIFSDFDSRPYSQRALSVDFLEEARRASRDKKKGIELKLLIPKAGSNASTEAMVRKRLREHFKKHFLQVQGEKNNIITLGGILTMIGIAVMFIATLVAFKYGDENFMMTFLVIFLEPAGWFLFWEGLNLVVFEARHKNPDLKFYKKMSNGEITFLTY